MPEETCLVKGECKRFGQNDCHLLSSDTVVVTVITTLFIH